MENFIQVCNYQGDPILVGLTSGNGFWALPPGTAFTNLILVARTEESGTVCYEDPILRTTTSSFPRRTSPAARKLIAKLETMTRAESEELFGRYSEEVSATHMEMLEKYRSECEQSRPVAEVVPSAPPPAALAPPPPMEIFERNADGRHQLALLRCGNLNKLATVSNRNWKRRFFRLTAVSLAYFESANVSSGTVPKGEVQIAGDGRVEIVPKVDGFGFRYTAPSVSSKVVLSANSEIEREAWMDSLSTASALMGKCLREPIALRSLQSFPKDDATAFLAALAAQTSRKAVALLSKDGVSIHDPRSISKVQAVFGINSSTTVHFIAERSVALLNAPGIWYSKGNELQGIAMDFTNMFDRWKLRILGATASATAQRGFDGVRDRAQSMGSVEASPGLKGNALEMAALRRLQKKQSPSVSRDVAPTSEVCSQYASQIKRLGDELEEMEDTASTVEITKNAIASVNEVNFIPNTADSVSRRSSDTDGDQKRDAKASQERKASKLALYRKEQRRSYVAANSTVSHAPNGIDTSATLVSVDASLDALFVQRRPSATSAVYTVNDQLIEASCMDSPTNYPAENIPAISMPPSAPLNALQVAALRKQRRQSTVINAPVVEMSTDAASTPALDEELAAVELGSWEKEPLSFEVKEHVTKTETDNAHSFNALKTVPLVDNATLSAVSVTVSARPSNALKMAALRRQMRKQPSTTMNSSDVRQSTIEHAETAVVVENEDVEVAAVSPTPVPPSRAAPVPPNRAAPAPMDSFPAFVSSGRDEDSSVTSDLPRLSDLVMRFATPLNQIVVEDSVINGAIQQHQPLQKDRDIARSESSMTIDSEEPRRGQQSSSSQDGSLTLLDMFDRAQHKPLVRLIFEHFSHPNSYLRTTRSRSAADNVLDVSALQTLSYELGCYCSLEDAQLAIQLYSSKSKNKKKRTFLGYEDFLVYWRSHAVFSTLRSFDPLAKRRVCIAAQFRAYDVLAQGHIKLSSFRLVFEQLLASNYLRPMKQYVGPPSSQRLYADILAAVDKYSSGRVSLNLFVAYMDMNVPIYTSKPSKLGRLWAKLLPVTATKQLSGRTAQQQQPVSNNSNSGMRDLRVEHFRRSVTADDLVALMSDEEESEEVVEEAANEVDTHLMAKEDVVEKEELRGECAEVGGDVQEAIALRCDSPPALPTARAPSPTPSVSSSSSAKRRRLLAMQGLRGKAPAAVAPPVATPEEVHLVVTTPHEVRPALPPISASASAPPAPSTFTSTSAAEVMSNPLQRMRPLRPSPASLPAPPPPPSTSPAPLKHLSVPLTPPAPPLKCASPPPPPPPSIPVTPLRQRRMSQPSAPTPRTPDCIPSGVCEVSSDFRPLRSTSSEALPSLSHSPSSGLISYEDVLVERHALHQLEEDLKELTSLTERRMQAREQKALSRLHLVAAAHRDQAESQRTHLAILNDAFAMQRMEDAALLRECASRVLVEEVRQQALEQRQLAALRHLADDVGAMHGDVCRRRSELARSLVTSHSTMVEAAELVSGRDYFNSLQYLAARRQVAETLKMMDADLSKSASTFADGYRGEDEHKGVDMAVVVDLSSGEAGDWDYAGYADEDC